MTGGIVAILITFIVVGGVSGATMAYFALQRHRADAVAMAGFRKLAEEAVAEQEALRTELAGLNGRIAEVESLLRSVDT
ncbi:MULTISPECIES: hypothetical protein [unclassified Streptomyces]|uniref:hypothetical protein n=1 Tax=unclassified Streptomyces TaxID=2593676 RepID=UPI00093F94B0|nr:hypothetical protein [Streptomyces sp. CB02058]OKI91161.1 hypothetical protein AMK10_30210 [Streptomyces sp. CB02058]